MPQGLTMVGESGCRRRTILRALVALGLAPACGLDPTAPESDDDAPLPEWPDGPWNQPPEEPVDDADGAADANLHALMDLMIPAQFDDENNLTSPGALQANAPSVLALSTFLPAARALALLPEISIGGYDDLDRFDAALKAVLSADLDRIAFDLHPLTPFSSLSRLEQGAAVHAGMDDPLTRPLLLLVRSACFIAYLGAVQNDAGLQAIGFPAFEDWDDRLATRGYPRTGDGRLIDAEAEDLGAIAATGELDDYTFNEAPAPTDGDDLSEVLDANGDLI